MKLFTTILFCLLLTSVQGQGFQDFFSDTVQSLNVRAEGSFNYGVRKVNNEFTNHFMFSDKIHNHQKEQAYKDLKTKNSFGGDLLMSVNAEIPFDTLFGKSNMSLVIGIESVEHVDGSFTDDLFKFTFSGNKQFAGKSAELAGTSFNYFNYQQINFGFIKYKKNRLKEGIIFSLIKAQEHQAITVPRGTLYTESLGRELALDIHYIYNSSDTANKGFQSFNGFGISTDFFTEFKINGGDKIQIAVNDIGFLHWNTKSIHLEADSTFMFDGVEIDNIFDLNDSLVSEISQDSILNLISPNRSKESYDIALPTSFNLSYVKQFNERIQLIAGVNYRILANYFPLVYTKLNYKINPTLVAQWVASYGGYGMFNSGLSVAKSFANKIQVYAGSGSVFGWAVPKAGYSNDGFIGLKMYF